MTDKLWLLPFGPDQIHLPALHSPDSAGFLIPTHKKSKRFSSVGFQVVACFLRFW